MKSRYGKHYKRAVARQYHTARGQSDELKTANPNPSQRLPLGRFPVHGKQRLANVLVSKGKSTCKCKCSFWRRGNSILVRTARSVFLGRGRPPEVRSVPIPLRIPLYKKRNLNQTTRVRLRPLLAQAEGFEPPCR